MKFKNLLIEDADDARPEYDFTHNNIFSCPDCHNIDLVKDLYASLENSLQDVQELYNGYQNSALSSTRFNEPEYVFLYHKFTCSSCKKDYKAFLYFYFRADDYVPVNVKEFLLFDIYEAEIANNVDGLYNRDQCQEILDKFFIRWNIMSRFIYCAVPFFGNTYQKAGKIIDLWLNFLYRHNDKKTILITRPESINILKKSLDNEEFEKIMFNIPILKNAVKKRGFHAKFYCGIDPEAKTEVVSGSHNIHDGTYIENITYKQYELDQFFEKYISKLGVFPGLVNQPAPQKVLIINTTLTEDIDSMEEYVYTPAKIIQQYYSKFP